MCHPWFVRTAVLQQNVVLCSYMYVCIRLGCDSPEIRTSWRENGKMDHLGWSFDPKQGPWRRPEILQARSVQTIWLDLREYYFAWMDLPRFCCLHRLKERCKIREESKSICKLSSALSIIHVLGRRHTPRPDSTHVDATNNIGAALTALPRADRTRVVQAFGLLPPVSEERDRASAWEDARGPVNREAESYGVNSVIESFFRRALDLDAKHRWALNNLGLHLHAGSRNDEVRSRGTAVVDRPSNKRSGCFASRFLDILQ